MKKYIECKLIEAEEMNKYDYYMNILGTQCFENNEEGYLIKDKYNYRWYPKEFFNKIYLELDDNKNLPSGVSIGHDMVRNFIKSYEVIERDGKTTIVHATLLNGYKMTEASSCVDPLNYDKEIGTQICLQKIEEKIWGLLGFLLQTGVNGLDKC